MQVPYTLDTSRDLLTSLFGGCGNYDTLALFLETTAENFAFAGFASTLHIMFYDKAVDDAENTVVYPGFAQHIFDRDKVAQTPDLGVSLMSLLCFFCGDRDCVLSVLADYALTF